MRHKISGAILPSYPIKNGILQGANLATVANKNAPMLKHRSTLSTNINFLKIYIKVTIKTLYCVVLQEKTNTLIYMLYNCIA